MSTESGKVTKDDRSLWRGASFVERLTLMLGPVLFALLVVGGYIAAVNEWHKMTFGDYLQGVAAGAGLLAVGHGIHRSERLRRGG